MAKLNPEQTEAVRALSGPVLVLAGAGSGKTRVITHRVQSMVEEHGISASQILALSFTNKSAKEMKERLRKMVGKSKLRGIFMGTFHSLGVRILKTHIDELGYRTNFSILAAGDAQVLCQELLKQHKIDEEEIDPRLLMWSISQAKNKSCWPEDQIAYMEREFDDRFGKLFSDYNDHLTSYNTVDFDDLIGMPSRIMHKNEAIKLKYRKRFKYILIDEFQDTNPAQYELIRLLLNDANNIFVVGDDDQSIYGWRGADVSLILNFEKDFPNAKAIRLEQNYRSTGLILEAANRVIANNTTRHDKKLRANLDFGSKITYYSALDEEHEAELVADAILDLKKTDEVPLNEVAILLRTNFQSRPFEEAFRRRNIPYHLIGGYKFFDRKEVKDILSYLRVIANPKDEISLLRIINYPKRGIGATTTGKINEYCRNHGINFYDACNDLMEHPDLVRSLSNQALGNVTAFAELIENLRNLFLKDKKMSLSLAVKDLVTAIDYEGNLIRSGEKPEVTKAKMYNINELVSSVHYFEQNWDDNKAPTIYDYLTKIATQFDDQEEEAAAGQVQLLTVHLSKGLEFPYVFIAGLEEELFPNLRAIEDRNDGLEEERRLFYVAVTRAMKKLFLSSCQNRKRFGELIPKEVSRFFDELGEDLVHAEIWDEARRAEKRDEDFDTGLDDLKAMFN